MTLSCETKVSQRRRARSLPPKGELDLPYTPKVL